MGSLSRGISVPYSGRVYAKTENYYGIENASSPGYTISGCIINAKIDTGTCYEPKWCIGSGSAASLYRYMSTPSDPTFHLEWIYDSACTFSLASYCINRIDRSSIGRVTLGIGNLTPLTFEMSTNMYDSVVSHRSQFKLLGCKCKSITLSGKRGDEWIYSADFSVKRVTSAASVSTSSWAPQGLNRSPNYCLFNTAGSVFTHVVSATYPGSWSSASAFITDNISVTIDHSLQDLWTSNSPWKVEAIPGALKVTGSSDVSIDEGGGAVFANIQGRLSACSLQIQMQSAATCKRFLSLRGVKYDSFSVELNTSGNVMMTSKPFNASLAKLI